ncbi:MAG: CoB--CoM heterodisulfide reductase iron-sulfur subunit A family protein, partial [bacterium]
TDKLIEEQFGAIIIATGYDLYPVSRILEYGGGKHLDVIDGLCFERLLSPSGPTQGEIKRPSDGKVPKRVAFICCVGSRDPEHHLPYCSKICCMYSTKHALLYKEHLPEGEAVVFCIDVRTPSKDYEEFYARTKQEAKVIYIRGKPSRIIRDEDSLSVWAVDTVTGKQVRYSCDMVVLSTAVVSSPSSSRLAEMLRLPTNQYGFFSEAHAKLRPVESVIRGVFIAGCCQGPKDIPETVSQASATASKVFELLSGETIQTEPMVAWVDEDLCSGCKVCIESCAYKARAYDEEKKVVIVNEALCQGCGACVVACPTRATQQKNLTDQQFIEMVEVVFGEDQGSI